jgi:hypothetical protein
MKILLFTIVCFSFLFVKGQNQDPRASLIDKSNGNFIYISQYVDIRGSQFLYDKWLKGKVSLNNGYLFSDLQLKFDIYANKFVLNKNDTAFEISSAVHRVWMFPKGFDTSEVLLFENGFQINPKVNASIYLQVLAEGKITVLKYINKYLEDYNEYGNANVLKRFNDFDQYFIYKNGQYQNIKLSKKDLEDIVQDKWTEVSSFLIKNNLSGKDEKSWTKSIQYYNSLMSN